MVFYCFLLFMPAKIVKLGLYVLQHTLLNDIV